MTLDRVLAFGFDKSFLAEDGYIRVRCSECQALVINRVPCHETGCPNSNQNEEEDD